MAYETKRDYQAELKAQIVEYLERYPYEHGTRDFPSADELYNELVRPIAVESWKNGKEAAMRGPREHRGTRRPPAIVKGTALANGRLVRMQE